MSLRSPALAGSFFTTNATWEVPEEHHIMKHPTVPSVLFLSLVRELISEFNLIKVYILLHEFRVVWEKGCTIRA